jgi:tripartite ATP-independent transporter DctM subunit
MDSFALLAIPLFILLSAPIAESDASKDLYETLHKWLYKIPGGLGIANMIGCGIFAALCGSSPATAAAIGGIGIPEMRKRGYSPALSTGLIAHAGTFGILIPPSVTMILYGVATETSIGKCFIAGVLPGILEIILSCLWVQYFLLPQIGPIPARVHVLYRGPRQSGVIYLAGTICIPDQGLAVCPDHHRYHGLSIWWLGNPQ